MVKRKYRIKIDLYGVRFGVKYGHDLNELKKEAIKDIHYYQKLVSRNPATLFVHEDIGERYMQGQRSRVKWKPLSEETVPYEARPQFEVGQQFVQYEEDQKTIKLEGIIVEKRLDPKYDDFYYTMRRKGETIDEIEMFESDILDWEEKIL